MLGSEIFTIGGDTIFVFDNCTLGGCVVLSEAEGEGSDLGMESALFNNHATLNRALCISSPASKIRPVFEVGQLAILLCQLLPDVVNHQLLL